MSFISQSGTPIDNPPMDQVRTQPARDVLQRRQRMEDRVVEARRTRMDAEQAVRDAEQADEDAAAAALLSSSGKTPVSKVPAARAALEGAERAEEAADAGAHVARGTLAVELAPLLAAELAEHSKQLADGRQAALAALTVLEQSLSDLRRSAGAYDWLSQFEQRQLGGVGPASRANFAATFGPRDQDGERRNTGRVLQQIRFALESLPTVSVAPAPKVVGPVVVAKPTSVGWVNAA